MPRPRIKTETLSFRVDPEVKQALAVAAASERRSMANMLELIVLDWCDKHPPAVAGPPTKKKKKNRKGASQA